MLLFISAFCFGQMPDISDVWQNNSQFYYGTIGTEKMPLKLKIETAAQDVKDDQQYFLAGLSVVDTNSTKFEGKLKITSYKDERKGGKIFGEYTLYEEGMSNHSGTFKGKFIYTFKWNKKTQKIESPFLQFAGDWENYSKTLNYRTSWKNEP